MADFLAAVCGNPLVPTPHWEPRCELCALRRTHPDVYGWLTQTVLGVGPDGSLTQAEIAAEVARRTGLGISQSQVSHHKTKHVDPSLQDALETMTGHLVLLEFCAGMEPAEMAVAYAKLALVKTGQLMHEAEEPASVASLAGAVARLGQILQTAEGAEADATLAKIEARLAALREQTARTDYEAAFGDWVEQHYPDLAPLLAEPERLRALLAERRA